MSRRVFISFLGTNNYVEVRYLFPNNEKSMPVRFVQEALIQKECDHWGGDDRIYIFCTPDAEKLNWFDNGQPTPAEENEKVGLETRLKRLNLSVPFEKVLINAGFEESDIWDVFDAVYKKLQKGDEIYYDVTHAFRSIPLFSTVLFNYSRFMKETNVVSIKYGAFEKLGPASEVRKQPSKERGFAPIVELTAIVQLQTLTRIADDFKSYGKICGVSEMFETLSGSKKMKSLVSDLRNGTSKLEEYILLNRVEQIREGSFINIINSSIQRIRRIAGLSHAQRIVLEKMEDSLSSFCVDGGNRNIIAAIKWALNYNMIQQAYTLAQEFLITLATERYKDKCFYSDAKDPKKWRIYMSSLLGMDERSISENRFLNELSNNVDLAKELLSLPEVIEVRKNYSVIAANRNILSHGKRSDLTLEQFKEQLQIRFDACLSILSPSNNN